MLNKHRNLFRVGMYAQNPLCCYCGKLMKMGGNRVPSATIEHVIPLGEGGKDEPSNMVLVHKGCNNIENWLHQMEDNMEENVAVKNK